VLGQFSKGRRKAIAEDEDGEGAKMKDEEKRRAANESYEDYQITEELKLSDKLALQRTVLAADRTILAAVRTSMAFIGFGFTIFNVLKYFQEHAPMNHLRPETPRNVALFMLAAGTIPLLAMTIQYSRILKRLGRKKSVLSNPNFLMATATVLLGAILLVTLLGRILL
jgi:putative membrane protein